MMILALVLALYGQTGGPFEMDGIWAKTGETTLDEAWIDTTSVRTLSDGKKMAWIDYRTKKPAEDGVARSVAKLIFDCTAETATVAAIFKYLPNGQTKFSYSYPEARRKTTEIAPGSLMRGLFDYTCKDQMVAG